MNKIIGSIVNIKRFEIHDGDGLRTTLFVKGCPLKCRWCHNPESISPRSELGYYAHKCIGCGSCVAACPHGAHTVDQNGHVFHRDRCKACGKCAEVCMADALLFYGKRVTPEEILPRLTADVDFYKNSGGGVTISGGEPLLQSEFCAEVLRLLKEQDINTAVDTCLFASREQLDRVIPYTDTFLVDVKAIDAELHHTLTGQYNTRILENIRYLDALGKDIEVRIPYIPGQNSGEIEKIAEFLATVQHLKGVRVLPYHNLSGTKYASLDMVYPLASENTPIPTKEETEAACDRLRAHGIKVLTK
ncbi:MAG: glycyl-radical enzyme activating protein [Clostridia bacterium]|nr:glycyl-radical enzyme activating protein [Clostridia bacterium]